MKPILNIWLVGFLEVFQDVQNYLFEICYIDKGEGLSILSLFSLTRFFLELIQSHIHL